MSRRIEIVKASDPEVLKQQLEVMVNDGWEIRGVVSGNPYNPYTTDPFVILERHFEDAVDENLYENEEPGSEELFNIKPEPPKKEVTISMGGE